MPATRSMDWRRAVARIFFAAAAATVAASSQAAVTFTTEHGLLVDAFDSRISSEDLIHGQMTVDVDVFENPSDSFGQPSLPGWHNANTLPEDQVAALTDGVGMRASGLTGLLNDNFPVEQASGRPAKIVEYPLAAPADIGRINILTGNRNNADGRIFSTTYVEYSTDNGFNYQVLGYFQSDPSGTVNGAAPLEPAQRSTWVSIFDDASNTMLTGVTNLIFNFYSVDNTGGQMRDPFDGVSAITGIDDSHAAAFVSPLVLEIDVLPPAEAVPGDYNNNSVVDAADYVIWRESVGADSLPNRGPGIEGAVGPADYDFWRSVFGTAAPGLGASTAVPEPAAAATLLIGFLFVALSRRRAARVS